MYKRLIWISSILFIVLFFSLGTVMIQNTPQDKGIGPAKNVEIGPLNKKMVDDGKAIFNSKCIVCHDIDQIKVGPPIRNISKTRTPEFVLNLLLNSAQMQKENITIKALIKKYNNVPMPDPALNQAQARSVFEYMRSLAK